MRTLLLTLTLLLLSMPATAETLTGACQIQFFGTSTLHDFEGTGSCQPFTLELWENPNGNLYIQESALLVPVTSMKTGNDTRDEQMYDMFEAGPYPTISGQLASASLYILRKTLHESVEMKRSLPFDLLIRDLQQPVSAWVTDLVDTKESFSFVLNFELSLLDYQLEPPSILGLISVDDRVRVKVSVSLDPLPQA